MSVVTPHAIANEPGATTTIIPNSTTVTVLPNSTTTVTLPPGVSIPPGAVLINPPGSGTVGTTPPGTTTTTTATTTQTFEVNMDQLGTLTAEQRAALEVAMKKAEAEMPAVQSTPNIPSSIAGLSPEMLKSLTPDQLKLLEKAKTTGTIPAELKSLLANLSDVPGEIYAKLSDQQKSILDSARASGVLDKNMVNDIIDGLTPAEIIAFTSGKSISTSIIQTVVAKKTTTITCVKGKTTRKITGVGPKCPSGFTKK